MLSPTAIYTILISIALILGGVWVSGNVNLLPAVASSNAPIYDELFKVLFIIGTVLFIGMVGLVVYSLIQFRRKPGETGDGLAIEDNLPLEIFWTAVPAIVILFVGLYSYDIYERMGGMQTLSIDGHEHASMTSDERIWGGIGYAQNASIKEGSMVSLPVEVTAMQFAFLFHYPKGNIISGELFVPIKQGIACSNQSACKHENGF